MRLGERLAHEGAITGAHIAAALAFQRAHGGRFGSALVALGYLTEADVARGLGRSLGVPSVTLADLVPDASAVRLVPAALARQLRAVPVVRSSHAVTVAMTDPGDVRAIEALSLHTGLPIEPAVACEAAVSAALDRCYGAEPRNAVPSDDTDPVDRVLAELGSPPADRVDQGLDRREVALAAGAADADEAPVTRLVNALLASAMRRGASDIHLEPYERELRVRFRVDGVLHTMPAPPWTYRDSVASRIKILAQLDIAEKRLPQDGRFNARLRERGVPCDLDVRVSSLPTLFGEKIVLRLLERDRVKLDLAQLGLEADALRLVETAIGRPWGLVLVTGPTGSGKTSTLYSALTHLNRPGVNIVTAEDPVEMNLPGITQVAVRESIGLTFATALRAFLRQDPDIMLVGEIRDNDTATIAVKAALTGHLVLSTLHTSDAPSTISRLSHMGIDPVLLSSALSLVCAQRLVRRICDRCRVPDSIDATSWREAGGQLDDWPQGTAARGAGCGHCAQTGFRGRVGIFEVMTLSEGLRAAMLAGASTIALRACAEREGMRSLRQAGLRAVRAGITTLDEVRRETVLEC